MKRFAAAQISFMRTQFYIDIAALSYKIRAYAKKFALRQAQGERPTPSPFVVSLSNHVA